MKGKNDQKTFLGLPMRWEAGEIFSNMWNKEDDRLFPPKSFGIGWSINFYILFKKLGLIKDPSKIR